MNHAVFIFDVNTDAGAPIFKIAHYGVVGNLYDIVPKLIEKCKAGE